MLHQLRAAYSENQLNLLSNFGTIHQKIWDSCTHTLQQHNCTHETGILAVRSTIVFMKAILVTKQSSTHHAAEMLRMPGFVECRHTFLQHIKPLWYRHMVISTFRPGLMVLSGTVVCWSHQDPADQRTEVSTWCFGHAPLLLLPNDHSDWRWNVDSLLNIKVHIYFVLTFFRIYNCQSICYTTVLPPFFPVHPGEPVPEKNFWTSWCKGRPTEADTQTIWLGATPSRLTSAHLHHPHIF